MGVSLRNENDHGSTVQRLDDLAATLACVNPPDHEQFTHQTWVRVIHFELTGATPVARLLT